jgi:hypothetical protein
MTADEYLRLREAGILGSQMELREGVVYLGAYPMAFSAEQILAAARLGIDLGIDELLARYRGSLSTGGELRRTIEQLRDEWHRERDMPGAIQAFADAEATTDDPIEGRLVDSDAVLDTWLRRAAEWDPYKTLGRYLMLCADPAETRTIAAAIRQGLLERYRGSDPVLLGYPDGLPAEIRELLDELRHWED